MTSKRARLDRFISLNSSLNRRDVRLAIAQKRILVNGKHANNIHQVVSQFCHITFDNQTLQANTPVYIMLNKPAGRVSATKDSTHPTVVGCLPQHLQANIHIVGRLDFNSTGLILLTNNGAWSRHLTSPENKVNKIYEVELEQPINDDEWPQYISAFANGMYFAFEDLTTQPAKLERLTATSARVTLVEGRYHQIKRMFGRFRNKVIALHRTQIGALPLDRALRPAEHRLLNDEEIIKLSNATFTNIDLK